MDSSLTSRRLRQLIRWLTAAAASVTVVTAMPARADLIDERNEMVAKFINDMHADPLVADCAAHGAFVASTSNVIDRVVFPPESFDNSHASIKPWNDSFDEGKQRVKVDNIVTVTGQGIAKDKDRAPYALSFRCGYVGPQMLAFSWNDPVPAAKPRSEHSTRKGKSKHGAKKSTRKSAAQ